MNVELARKRSRRIEGARTSDQPLHLPNFSVSARPTALRPRGQTPSEVPPHCSGSPSARHVRVVRETERRWNYSERSTRRRGAKSGRTDPQGDSSRVRLRGAHGIGGARVERSATSTSRPTSPRLDERTGRALRVRARRIRYTSTSRRRFARPKVCVDSSLNLTGRQPGGVRGGGPEGGGAAADNQLANASAGAAVGRSLL